MEPILIAQNLRKTFKLSSKQQKLEKTHQKVKVAVDGLSFTANKGEIFGLLGPNGAGKTTTLRMLATLIRPDEGDATLDGISVVKNPDAVRSRVGFLTGELKLADLHGVDPATAAARKTELFGKFGIDEFAEVKVGSLSTGMKQKVSLVISVVHDPDVIIFDEPTNGLDVLTAKVVTDFLLELRERGKTIILSTHIFSLVEKLCDRVGVIIGGRMVACDTLIAVCDGMSLEDRFFELYKSTVGEEV